MRELKFRVYDKDLGKYLEGCEIDSLMAELSAEGNGREVIIKQLCPARYIFEQYTELKDINGNEIYEGDILKFEDSLFKIGWFDEGARFGAAPIKNCDFGMGFSLSKCEIIGNIHNKSELSEAE